MSKPNYRARTGKVDLSTVGGRIIHARKQAGISQEELAELIGTSKRSMQAYEADEVVPYRKLNELSEILNVTKAWILHGDAAEQPVGDVAKVLGEIRDLLQEQLKMMKS